MARLDDLREIREGLIERMAECSSDQNYAVMGRLLADVVKQIAELEAPAAEAPATGGVIVDFQKRLADRTGAGSPSSSRPPLG